MVPLRRKHICSQYSNNPLSHVTPDLLVSQDPLFYSDSYMTTWENGMQAVTLLLNVGAVMYTGRAFGSLVEGTTLTQRWFNEIVYNSGTRTVCDALQCKKKKKTFATYPHTVSSTRLAGSSFIGRAAVGLTGSQVGLRTIGFPWLMFSWPRGPVCVQPAHVVRFYPCLTFFY